MRLGFSQLVEALLDAGLTDGCTVMVQSSLRNIGPVEGASTRDEVCNFYYRAIRAVIGDSGTLLVHTPFEDYARFHTPFDVQHSPSRAGIFSEYVRTMRGAVRSKHPIVSVAGVGPNAELICGGNHFSGFGWDSPWSRMYQEKVYFLALGLGLSLGCSFTHFIEAMYNVPYQYTKLYDVPVTDNNRRIFGHFTLTVRYLDFSIRYNSKAWENLMLLHYSAREVRFSRGLLLQCVTSDSAFEGGMAALNENIFYFLEDTPKFRSGEIPVDGATGEMKLVYCEPR